MIIYQVTAKVQPEMADEFVEWMTSQHIPDVVNTGCFQQASFCRTDSLPGKGGPSFIIQYHCVNHDALENYFQYYAPALRAEFNEKFGEKCELSRKLMEVLKEIHLTPDNKSA